MQRTQREERGSTQGWSSDAHGEVRSGDATRGLWSEEEGWGGGQSAEATVDFGQGEREVQGLQAEPIFRARMI